MEARKHSTANAANKAGGGREVEGEESVSGGIVTKRENAREAASKGRGGQRTEAGGDRGQCGT